MAWEDGDQEFFRLVVRKGKWTKKYKGVEADCVRGQCRGLAIAWCRKYGFPKSMTHYFRKYGRGAAKELSKEYCRRASFFFRLYRDACDEHFAYIVAHIEAYEETSDYIVFLTDPDICKVVSDKAEEIRHVQPRLG